MLKFHRVIVARCVLAFFLLFKGKGGDVMSVYEALYLMIAFGSFILLLLTYIENKKK